jgi:hypothetical protein
MLYDLAAFSRCVLATDPLCDALSCAEAWDYLRDVVLLTLSSRFLGDDEPLALIVCPLVCQALFRLVREGGWQVGELEPLDDFTHHELLE